MYVIHPEEHQFTEPEMIAKQILSATLGADKNLQRIDRVNHLSGGTAYTGIGQFDPSVFPDGSQKLKEQLAVQGVQDIVVLELEVGRYSFQLIQQEGTHHAQRVYFCEECQRQVAWSGC